MKYEDVLKRFVANQAQLLQQKQMKQQMKDQMYAEKANALKSFVPGQMQSPEEEYSETEHNPFEEGQEYRRGGMYEQGGLIDRSPLSFGAYIEPGMVAPSVNFNAGRFNANLSTTLPLDNIRSYSKNYNADLSFNAGKYGDIGLSRNINKDFENNPHTNTSLRYQVPLNNKLDLMLNANSSDLKDLKNNINASVGLKYTFEDGGPTRSVVENTSGPRADEMGNPMDYLSYINSDTYTGSMSDNEALMNPATGTMDKVYRQEGDPMSIDYIKSKLADKTVIKTPYNNLDPVHRYYDTELINSSRDNYDTYKQSHLKDKVEGNIQDYADMKDVVKGAYDHNLKNGYDDTDKITSYFGDQAKKEGMDIYDFMKKYYDGNSPNAIARQLLVNYQKKVKK
jgi:hypothetical protein